jgi:hypothetical protein
VGDGDQGGPTLAVDPQIYTNAAAKCHTLATAVGSAFDPLYNAMNRCSGMVGNYPAVKDWADAYDHHVGDFVATATTFANAVQNIGDLPAACGYNYADAEHRNGAPGPPAPRPTVSSPLYGADMPVAGPGSVFGGSGHGMSVDNIPGLLDKITAVTPVPNGDTDLMQTMATAWDVFARNGDIAGAANTIKSVAGMFGSIKAPDVDNFADHFSTLTNAANDLTHAASGIGPILLAHRDNSRPCATPSPAPPAT